MNPKNTWVWLGVAAALFAAILVLRRIEIKPPSGSELVLPGFKAAAAVSVHVHRAGQPPIHAERTNGVWALTEPINYPAQIASIESLLDLFERLTPATQITTRELRRRANPEAEFGFDPPQVSLIIQSTNSRRQVLIGATTAPGDQVYLQVVAGEGACLVDAELLKLIPRTADDWRDTALVDLRTLAFDRVAITNPATAIELQRNSTNNLWTMMHAMRGARADIERIAELFQKLQTLRVVQFVPDSPRPDLEAFGLQPAEMELALWQGTNLAALLQFGKSPATNANLVYARRAGGSVVTVPKDQALPWRAVPNQFRDRRLLTITRPVDQIEVRGGEPFAPFTLQRESSNTWRAVGQDIPVDTGLVNDFLNGLGALQIIQFKDAVTETDLQTNGFANPTRQVILRAAATNAPGVTNLVIAELSFGATNENTIFARRADETPIYVVRLAEFQQLATAPWQLRARRIWNFSTNDVARLTVQQAGKIRGLVRGGPNSWTLAPGSQGIVNNVFAVEEIASRLGELEASAWIECGEQNLSRYGISSNSLSLLFELKNGAKYGVEFGRQSPSGYPYAATKLNGQTWVFEFPIGPYELVASYLSFPPDAR